MIKLRKYQLEALNKIHNGCVVNGDMGSGKSIMSIAYYYLVNGGSVSSLTGGEYVYLPKEPMDLYIITTALKRNKHEWDTELAPFLLTTNEEKKVYDHTVVVDSWNNIAKYRKVSNAFFIFDEQRVVGRGKWVDCFLEIVKSNRWILLSATPGDNWGDYVPLFIANGFYRNHTEFSREHEVYARYCKFPKVERWINTKQLEYYRDLILVDVNFSRTTHSIHNDIRVNFDGVAYKELYRNRFDPWLKKPIQNASGLCYCLRKLVNTDPSRATAILELCEKHPKVIIYYNFDYELEILRNLVFLPGTQVAEWNGHKHDLIPVEAERWVYLVQYSAGSEGWNCIETDTMIFYSQNYSYRTMTQAEGRINRMNTPYLDLYYYHLVSSSAIDIAIGRALKRKKTFNERRFIKWD